MLAAPWKPSDTEQLPLSGKVSCHPSVSSHVLQQDLGHRQGVPGSGSSQTPTSSGERRGQSLGTNLLGTLHYISRIFNLPLVQNL